MYRIAKLASLVSSLLNDENVATNKLIFLCCKSSAMQCFRNLLLPFGVTADVSLSRAVSVYVRLDMAS